MCFKIVLEVLQGSVKALSSKFQRGTKEGVKDGLRRFLGSFNKMCMYKEVSCCMAVIPATREEGGLV